MFTGIVEETASVLAVEEHDTIRRIWFEAPGVARELALGDSVSVDGACLTVTELRADAFSVDVIGTTLDRTIAGAYTKGTRVNVERAARMDARLDGHLVQGHVDGVGRLRQSTKSGEYWLLDFEIPADVHRVAVDHGSVTVNGVSLTISELLPQSGVRIGIIPFTHDHTNLGDLAEGDPVNVEGDLIGKYVARILSARGHDSAGKPDEGQS